MDVTQTVANLQAGLDSSQHIAASMSSARNKMDHYINVFIGTSNFHTFYTFLHIYVMQGGW